MARIALAALIILILAGAVSRVEIGMLTMISPEDRVNAAYPLPEPLATARNRLLEYSSREERKSVSAQLDVKLKARALACAGTYSPSWLTTTAEIRNNLDAVSCFSEQDDLLAKWIGIRLAGKVLAQPPLNNDTRIPSHISGSEFIQSAYFAKNSGTALLETLKSIQIVDIHQNKILFSEKKNDQSIGRLSPNGRIFITGRDNTISLRESETGVVLVDIPFTRPHQFEWLDDRTAFYKNSDSGNDLIIDFDSGLEITAASDRSNAEKAIAAPNTKDTYILFDRGVLTKIRLDRRKTHPSLERAETKPTQSSSLSLNTSGSTADDLHHFSAVPQLTIVDLQTLKTEQRSLDPFRLSEATATPDPDGIIISGHIPANRRGARSHYIYSISKQTLRPIDQSQLHSTRYVYIPSIKRQGIIDDNQITLLGQLPTQGEIAVDAFVSNAVIEASQYQLEQASEQHDSRALLREQLVAQRYKQADPTAAWDSSFRSRHDNPTTRNARLGNLARDARIEAIGVYQGLAGKMSSTEGRKMGNAEVVVRSSSSPLVLVLSSYEPVNWKLSIASGAKVAAILLSSYYTSKVEGSGSIPVFQAGTAYAHKHGSTEYHNLNQQTEGWTGKAIDMFQGRYEGGSFLVNQ